jgi:hypothetical protein
MTQDMGRERCLTMSLSKQENGIDKIHTENIYGGGEKGRAQAVGSIPSQGPRPGEPGQRHLNLYCISCNDILDPPRQAPVRYRPAICKLWDTFGQTTTLPV